MSNMRVSACIDIDIQSIPFNWTTGLSIKSVVWTKSQEDIITFNWDS